MTIAEWCLLGAVLLYLITIAPFKAIGRSEFDNSNPRDEKFFADALRNRARGAHLNGIEAYPFFATAVLLAEFRGAPQSVADGLAVGFLIVRLAFVAAYLGNQSALRSVLWNVGFGINVALFTLPVWGYQGVL